MLISWSGRGLIVFPIIIVIGFVVALYVPSHSPFLWPAFTGIISGLIIYLLGNWWNIYKQPLPQEDALISTNTQYKKITHNSHRLYWIPIQYLGIALIVIGFVFILLSIIK